MTTKKPELVLIPWEGIEKIRVKEDPGCAGEYEITGRGGSLVGYDLSGLIPANNPEQKQQTSPTLVSKRNEPGCGWSHFLRGHPENVHLFNAIARELHNTAKAYLVMMRNSEDSYYVIGNTFAGEVEFSAGISTNSGDLKQETGDLLYYEFRCPYQLYPQCLYHGNIDIKPIEDFFHIKMNLRKKGIYSGSPALG